MGAEASKPMVAPPRDWEEPRKRISRPFEVISPCSDISNPSDFNRVRYNRQSQQYQLTAPQHRTAQATALKPYDSRASSSNHRRTSNKSGTSNPQNLPVAVRVRKSSSTAGTNDTRRRCSATGEQNNSGDIVAPGAFFFPTKESERHAERIVKKEMKPTQNQVALKDKPTNDASGFDTNKKNNAVMNMNINHITDNIKNLDLKKKTKKIRRGARKAAKNMKKKRDAIKRIAVVVANACMEESKAMRQHQELQNGKALRQSTSSGSTEIDRPELLPSASISRSRRRSEQVAISDLKAAGTLKHEGRNKKELVPSQLASTALHREDVYFDRLSVSSSVDASPFVRNMHANNRVTSILEGNKAHSEGRNDVESTPKDRKYLSAESPMDTPVSDLFSASDSFPTHRNDNLAIKNKPTNLSPVSSLMRFYTKTGPIEESSSKSCTLSEDEATVNVFFDEESEESSQKRESIDSQSSLYTTESKSYQNVNGGDLKLLGHTENLNDPAVMPSVLQSENEGIKQQRVAKPKQKKSKQKVSKLESLFRPILPALSTDDAQSVSSFDPYQIKVTESAPGIMQASNYMALGIRRSSSSSYEGTRKGLRQESPSMSILSMDSQRQPSPTMMKKMLSSQANVNSEFLFTDDYGPVRVARNPNKPLDTSKLSISTTESRNRLAQRATQKGVDIPLRNTERENDDLSFDTRSTRSERRVRFSEASVKVLPVAEEQVALDKTETKDIAVEQKNIPDDELECDKSVGSEHSNRKGDLWPHPESDEEEIEQPIEIRRKESAAETFDHSEVKNRYTRSCDSDANTTRESLESGHELDEDDNTEASPDSIHWTYNKNGVTPFVPGKSTANPTKSPFYRYQKAKTQFNTEHLIVPQKSPKKSPQKAVRKGSGGLVSMRVQELNHRVDEVRKLKRMRKKMTNPRLHTHNFDNKQPVRNRALMNYKTDIGSANLKKTNDFMAAKFNTIPDIDDDEASAFSNGTYQNAGFILSEEQDTHDDDDASSVSEMASVATIRQQRDSRGASVSSHTTASSGLTNLKKQVFRESDAAKSIVSTNDRKSFTSISDSTTMSSIIHKENESYLPFRSASTVVKPSEQRLNAPPAALYLSSSKGTPAMKWRTLAAAAAEKDALKASSTKPKRTFGVRSMNCDEYHL